MHLTVEPNFRYAPMHGLTASAAAIAMQVDQSYWQTAIAGKASSTAKVGAMLSVWPPACLCSCLD